MSGDAIQEEEIEERENVKKKKEKGGNREKNWSPVVDRQCGTAREPLSKEGRDIKTRDSGPLEDLEGDTHRRRHCTSFRLLLRRQLWVNTVRMATNLRKLFRSRRSSTQGGRRKKNEITEGSEDTLPRSPTHLSSPSRRLFPLPTRTEGKVGPSEPVIGASSSSPRIPRAESITSSPASSPAKASLHTLFRKNTPPLPPPTPSEPNTKHMKAVRSKRLLKEFHDLTKGQMALKEPLFTVDLVNDCLYEWKVKLHRIDPESDLARDMVEFNISYILLNISFPEAFPFQPPFMRVLAPRLEKGFVMEGGAICMELLTPRGWASAYTIEAVIMQFAASLVKGQGRISRKHKNPKEFNKRSAEASFRSLVKTHDKYGWVTPPLSEG